MTMTAFEDDDKQAQRGAWKLVPAVVAAGISGGIVFPILPVIALHEGLSLASIGLILSINRISRMFSNPWIGQATDRFGARTLLLIGLWMQLVILGLYLLGIELHEPAIFFFIGRMLHGPASACIYVASQTLALDLGGLKHRGQASGIVSTALSAGTPVGFLIGGFCFDFLGASMTFVVTTLAPLIALFFARDWPESCNTINRNRERDVLWQSLRMVFRGRFLSYALISFMINFSANGVVLASMGLFISSRNIYLLGFSQQTSSAVLMSLLVVCTMCVTPFAGRLADHPRWRMVSIFLGMLSLGFGLVCVSWSQGIGLLSVGIVSVGLGSGFITVPLLSSVVDGVAYGQRGRALGGLQFFSDLGGSFGPIAGTWLLAISSTASLTLALTLDVILMPMVLYMLVEGIRTHQHHPSEKRRRTDIFRARLVVEKYFKIAKS